MNAPGQGRKKTPTKILEQRGSWRAKVRNKTEPQLEPETPAPPKALKGYAKKTWNEMCVMLEDIGVLTKVDGKALERYCRAWAQWCELAAYDDSKLTIETVEDLRTVHAHLDRMLKLSEHLLKFEMQYGLTPASRPNVHRVEKPAHGNAKQDKTRFFAVK